MVYLDIETGGDPEDWGGVAVVGLYDGQEVRQFVAGNNMWLLNDVMKEHDVVVAFAGSTFDLPVLRQVFSNFILPPVHIDLRWPLKRLGYTGGLKRIERRLGIARPPEVDGLGRLRRRLAHVAGAPGRQPPGLADPACLQRPGHSQPGTAVKAGGAGAEREVAEAAGLGLAPAGQSW